MAAATSKYHLTLNGQGIILMPGSYRRRAQQPNNPRFSSGDNALTDLSYWQFLAQLGLDGEGQEKFTDTAKYRQSAGWDLRQKRAYLGRTIETVTPTTAFPSMQNVAGFSLYEDFEASTPSDYISASKWNTISNQVGRTRMASIGSSRRGCSSGRVSGDLGEYEARKSTYGATDDHVLMDDTGQSATGTWQFTVYTETSAKNVVHAAFCFLANASGGYVLEISGSNMTVAKLIKFTRSGASFHVADTDTTILTMTPTGGSATAIVYKITRDASGNFEVFEDGVSLGTITDATYSTSRYVGFTTYTDYVSMAAPTQNASTWIDDVYLPGGTTNNAGIAPKAIAYNGGLYFCYSTTGTVFAFTTVRTGSIASNLPKIVHQNAKDIFLFSRDGNISSKNLFLASVRNQVLRTYSGETQVATVTLTTFATCVIPISSTKILCIGTTAELNGVPCVELVTFDAGAWTVASQKVLILEGGVSGTVAGQAALDSSGTVYFATNDPTLSFGTQPSRVYAITTADLGATNITISSVYETSDLMIRGVVFFNSAIHFYGARIRGTDSYATIIKLNGTVVYESTKAISLYPATEENKFNHGIMSVWKSIDNLLFLGMNDLDLWSPILQLDTDGNVREVASFASGQFSSAAPNVLPIAEYSGLFYLINGQAGTIRRTSTARGTLGADFATCVLEFSRMGSNTPLIQKSLYSVTIELSALPPVSYPISVIVNGTTVGTIASTDSSARKEIALTSELTAADFTVKLSMSSSSTWTGYVKTLPLLKFLPTQFKKLAWAFIARIDRTQRLIDGSLEAATLATRVAALKAAWASNIPVTLVDKDGTSYSVNVTDFDDRTPLEATDSTKQESLVALECLEV